jgi:hypothetical protein
MRPHRPLLDFGFENGPKAESLIKISVWPALAISDFDMDFGPRVGVRSDVVNQI